MPKVAVKWHAWQLAGLPGTKTFLPVTLQHSSPNPGQCLNDTSCTNMRLCANDSRAVCRTVHCASEPQRRALLAGAAVLAAATLSDAALAKEYVNMEALKGKDYGKTPMRYAADIPYTCVKVPWRASGRPAAR